MVISALLRRIASDERGATAVEYGLIAALLVIAIVGALGQFAGSANAMFGDVSSRTAAVTGGTP